jgi:hypothetical protein
MLQRSPDDEAPVAPPASAPPAAAGKPTVATAPELKVSKSPVKPCACLVFIHNEERNARQTAELLHQHCAYNLAIISPDRPGERQIKVGKPPKAVDPNELFPRSVAEECRSDRKGCETFVAGHAKSPSLESTRKQFFLAIDSCSESFKLPVIALHNNSIADSRAYQKKRGKLAKAGKDPFVDLPRDIDKTAKPATGGDGGKKTPDAIKEMKDVLRKNFALGALTETKGTTNIYRWCASKDIARCHIGDTDRPDNVVWVTNEKDFASLKSKGVNVVLQAAAETGGESEKDLSTLFLTIGDLIQEEAGDRAAEIWRGLDFGWSTWREFWSGVGDIFDELGRASEESAKLRYINIETPAGPFDAGTTPEQHRVEQYAAIVETLRAAGLLCCVEDPAVADAAIRKQLEAKGR